MEAEAERDRGEAIWNQSEAMLNLEKAKTERVRAESDGVLKQAQAANALVGENGSPAEYLALVDALKQSFSDVTNTAVIGNGASCYPKSTGAETTCQGAARATPSGATVYRIEGRVQTTESTYGCGVATSSFGKTEVYTQVEIYKESS